MKINFQDLIFKCMVNLYVLIHFLAPVWSKNLKLKLENLDHNWICILFGKIILVISPFSKEKIFKD